MNITVYTGVRYHEFALKHHDVEIEGGDLWVYLVNQFNARTDTVAVFAKGEWKRVEFDRD